MAVPFSQIVAATFDDVVNERNKAADQWSDSSFLKALESLGGVKRTAGGATLQLTLDYRSNTATDFLATDMTATSTTKTDVLTAASYNYIPLVTPINWSLYDEAVNSEKSQKVDLSSSLVDNGLSSHDQAIENGAFALTATDGFLSLPLLYPEAPAAAVAIGSIDPAVETWWQSKAKDYLTGTALVADLTTLWNACSKGSSGRSPNIVVTSAEGAGILEGKMVVGQRYGKEDKVGRIGFSAVQFKSADVIFSGGYTHTAGNASFFMFNTMDTKLFVVANSWRKRREPIEHLAAAAMNMKIFSVVQFATRNRSRGGVAFTSSV